MRHRRSLPCGTAPRVGFCIRLAPCEYLHTEGIVPDGSGFLLRKKCGNRQADPAIGEHDEENQQQSSALSFYGTSFLTDCTGAVMQQLGRDEAGIAMQTYDLDEMAEMRMSWGVFRDRRPEYYGAISSPAAIVLPK